MSFYEDNGILAKIPGELIALASHTLPQPSAGKPAELQAEIDVPEVGRVQIRYRLKNSTRGKWTNWFWTAVFAEVLG